MKVKERLKIYFVQKLHVKSFIYFIKNVVHVLRVQIVCMCVRTSILGVHVVTVVIIMVKLCRTRLNAITQIGGNKSVTQ